ncbi:hypothetical protein LV779_23225 [Streptomyces thinghirensis]|nr:hypothetical protein [Streptomyces thinghirensis]
MQRAINRCWASDSRSSSVEVSSRGSARCAAVVAALVSVSCVHPVTKAAATAVTAQTTL